MAEIITKISAVTLAVQDMQRSVDFYHKLGFGVAFGGVDSQFSTMRTGDALINLAADPSHERRWWGCVIFRVEDVDAYHALLVSRGLQVEPPCDASWGERFFHVTDPDGHELSFAQLLSRSR